MEELKNKSKKQVNKEKKKLQKDVIEKDVKEEVPDCSVGKYEDEECGKGIRNMEELKNKSKKQVNKEKKKLQKDVTEKDVKEEVPDCSVGKYEDEECGKGITSNLFIGINVIDKTFVSQNVWITGFLQQVRKTGKQAFVVIRSRMATIQCVAWVSEKISKNMINFIGNIPKESVVKIQGTVVLVEKPIESCSQSNVEIQIETLKVVTRCKSRLPLQIDDATRPENDSNLAKVNLDTRLDNRTLELRTVTNQAIMKLKGGVFINFSTYLVSRDFYPIFCPSIISAASEGGANVFEVKYFGEKAYLAQSPQLYKQMCIIAGMEKVFTIGPVFRAENSNTHRHLTEFTGLDMEMQFNNHYHEVLHTICETLVHIFKELQTNYSAEIACVREQFPAEPFEYLEPTLILTFAEGVAMLNEAGIVMSEHEDLSTTNEKILGKLIKKKFSTDFYVLDKFPLSVRPFYTMPDEEYPGFSNSYDVFMRGEEIMSGAQRIHNAAQLRESAVKHGINLDSIKDYLESFEYGCKPHAGGGIGLDRVVMLFLGLDNIRRVSMFPRDPNRYRP